MAVPSLSEFFESTFLPLWVQGRLDPKTETSYRESVAHWKAITGDPPLDQITDLLAATFVIELGKRPGKLSPTMKRSSIHKHCINVQAILNLAGPRTAKNKKAQRLIAEVPFLDPPAVDHEPPCRDWTLDEIGALYDHADVATVPNDGIVTPADWWRCFICLAYFTGLRLTPLLHVEFSLIAGRWMEVPSGVSKRRKGCRVWLRQEVLGHIELVRCEGRARIVGWPRWSANRRLAYDQLRAIQAAAGFPEGRRFPFHSFRKTHLTVLASFAAASEHGMRLAQQSAGHSSLAITKGSYINASVQEQMLVRAMEEMPNPFNARSRPRESLARLSSPIKAVCTHSETLPDWLD